MRIENGNIVESWKARFRPFRWPSRQRVPAGADEVPNLAGAIGQLHDPFTECEVTRNSMTLAAVQMSADMSRYR